MANWEVIPDPNRTLCNAPWLVNVSGVLTISINQPSCTTNLVPIDSYWNILGGDYVIELDMWFISGTDHNIAFRFIPNSPKNNQYEFHFQSPNTVNLNGPPPGSTNKQVNYPIPNKADPYHIKINVETGNLELFIDDVLVMDHEYDESTDRFSSGKLALRAGTGGDPISETRFDNIVVTPIANAIDVPYFSQTSPQWNGDGIYYDSTTNSIANLGCSLTAAVMVLRSHGLFMLPDLTVLNPKTLNDWLVGHYGYGLDNGLAFQQIAVLTQNIADVAEESGSPFDFTALEYEIIPNTDYPRIDEILSSQEHPLIFEEIKSESPTGRHYDVAKGVVVSGEEYVIADPLDETRDRFLQPPDQLASVRYFQPTNTNLSNILLQADEDLDILITAPDGHQASEHLNEIENAHFYFQAPIVNYQDPTQVSGNPIWEFNAKHPQSGDYEMGYSTDTSGWYESWLYAHDQEGHYLVFKENIYVDSEYPTLYSLSYSQEDGDNFAVFEKKVDFDVLRRDIWAMRRQGLIKRHWVARFMSNSVRAAKRFYPRRMYLSKALLRSFEWFLNRYHPRYITNQAYDLLLDDLTLLRASL